jgi:predicted transcriptional regulator
MDKATMKTVTLDVASREDVTRRALEAFKGKRQRARISFATPELLWKVLTAKRWEVLKAMAGQGPLTIREVARRVERDVKAVHSDVHALINAGLLDRTETNQVVFPFDAVRVEFTLRAA